MSILITALIIILFLNSPMLDGAGTRNRTEIPGVQNQDNTAFAPLYYASMVVVEGIEPSPKAYKDLMLHHYTTRPYLVPDDGIKPPSLGCKPSVLVALLIGH